MMSPYSEEPHTAIAVQACEYSQEERELLLRLAHRSIELALQGLSVDITSPTAHLAEPRGAFTTLHLQGHLRGCIGYVLPVQSLYATVAEAARAAALDDPRFPPVTPAEAPRLKIEISVLSRLQPIRPEEIVIGQHGLVVTQGNRRGLLLPQVPIECDWDRETFLAQACRKAGLPTDAWQHGAQLQAFTAEVFCQV
jgi:AmmeMemoRadiSam system protein A